MSLHGPKKDFLKLGIARHRVVCLATATAFAGGGLHKRAAQGRKDDSRLCSGLLGTPQHPIVPRPELGLNVADSRLDKVCAHEHGMFGTAWYYFPPSH